MAKTVEETSGEGNTFEIPSRKDRFLTPFGHVLPHLARLTPFALFRPILPHLARSGSVLLPLAPKCILLLITYAAMLSRGCQKWLFMW